MTEAELVQLREGKTDDYVIDLQEKKTEIDAMIAEMKGYYSSAGSDGVGSAGSAKQMMNTLKVRIVVYIVCIVVYSVYSGV